VGLHLLGAAHPEVGDVLDHRGLGAHEPLGELPDALGLEPHHSAAAGDAALGDIDRTLTLRRPLGLVEPDDVHRRGVISPLGALGDPLADGHDVLELRRDLLPLAGRGDLEPVGLVAMAPAELDRARVDDRPGRKEEEA